MILRLVLKELNDNKSTPKASSFIIKILSSILILTLFILLEISIYLMLYEKFKIYDGFNEIFMTSLFFILMIIIIIATIPQIIKCFFNSPMEKVIYSVSPISKYDIIISKSISLYIKILFTSIITFFTIGICYGLKNTLNISFYFILFFGIIFISMFILSIALLLSIPTYYLYKLIKRNKIILIISTIIIALAIALLYLFTLNLFIDLIRGEGIDSIFNRDMVKALTDMSKYLYPIYPFIKASLKKDIYLNVFLGSCLSIISLLIALFLMVPIINDYYYNSKKKDKKRKSYVINYHMHSANLALIKKELSLALSNKDGIFSYLVLILLEPFLIFSIIKAINLIFKTGSFTYILTLFPSLYLFIDLLLAMLLISFINMNSSISLKKESETKMILKSIPISYRHQLFIKGVVIFIIGFIALLISDILLLLLNEITFIDFSFYILIGSSLIIILNLLSIFNDLKNKNKNNPTSLFIGLFYPIIISIVGVGISFLADKNIQLYIFYSVILGTNLIIALILGLIFYFKANTLFKRWEG